MEVKIILILLIIHIARIIIFKPRLDSLYCGIFGWAGKSVNTFNKAKFDIQGLYNDSRGGDSCGVTTDGEIYYGITGAKHYSDFLHKQSYDIPKLIPTVIGHTRKSSSGTISSDNAHPFGFGDYENSFEFIGVHNGTLHNQESLAKRYNIETTVQEKNSFGVDVFKRNKIDSEILLEIIYKEENFKVLSEYIGGAALLFTNTFEPNVLYVFKGASRFDDYDKGNDVEERPLFFYKEHKNSLYISSLQESLEAIGGKANENLFKFNPNTVYKITDGNIDKAERIEISRRQSHQRPATVRKGYDYCGYSFNRDKAFEDMFDEPDIEDDKVVKIQNEKEVRTFLSPVVFNKLRYYRNGHLINGVFTWIPEYGFQLLATKIEDAKTKAKSIINQAFDLEYGIFSDPNSVDEEEDVVVYPFTDINKKNPGMFYFYEGIMLETDLDFIALNGKAKHYTIWDLSEMSKHPVIDLDKRSAYSRNYESVLFKRTSFTGNVCPLGSSKIYYIEKGSLEKFIILERTNIIDKKEKKNNNFVEKDGQLILIPEKLNTDQDLLQKQFQEFCTNHQIDDSKDKTIEIEVIDEDETDSIEEEIVKESVESLMMPIYLKIQESIDLLHEYKEYQLVEEIIEVNEDYLLSLDEIIEKIY